MKNQDFSIFQKLFQIVSRGFLCTPPVSCGPKKMVSMGVSFHNVVGSPDMCRALHTKIWKNKKNYQKSRKSQHFRKNNFFQKLSRLFLEGPYALPRPPEAQKRYFQFVCTSTMLSGVRTCVAHFIPKFEKTRKNIKHLLELWRGFNSMNRIL